MKNHVIQNIYERLLLMGFPSMVFFMKKQCDQTKNLFVNKYLWWMLIKEAYDYFCLGHRHIGPIVPISQKIAHAVRCLLSE